MAHTLGLGIGLELGLGPPNTVAQYTTKLNTSIELDGDWEVGLTEISFPYNIENVADRECYFKISNPEFDTYIKIPLHGGYYSEFEKVVAAVTSAM